ncbi:MAG: dihydroxyacetone kinase subunit DhaK [Lachnospiraceae bacterium]|jgi:dihydroxyacetone kinase|nr:dihydroxyacetone kinase subunit DhaK [Lachnospiraceae bacterium]
MRKIINDPRKIVSEMCGGISMANPSLEFIERYNILKKRVIEKEKVSLISGGGSGHEPAHGGFIGKGMLDAAVCGDVFASPSQIQVYQAICSARSEKGTLLIIKNYSGDIMNFRNGAALAEAEGIRVDYVKVEDDIAVKDSSYTVGRRGVAGTVLVHKCAGAAAEEGLELEEVKRIAQHAADHVRTIGFALSSCTVPAAGVPTFAIEEGEMEYGVGIHGEPGRTREKALSADELAERMTEQLSDSLKLKESDEITLLINGFGGTPEQELYILTNSVMKALDKKHIRVYRSFAGNYMTSIDMAGASVSFMKMDAQLKKYLDLPSLAPAFRVDGKVEMTKFRSPQTFQGKEEGGKASVLDTWKVIHGSRITIENITAMVLLMSRCIIRNEVDFCRMDSYAGDGDFGMSVAKGFCELERQWNRILKEHHGSIGDFLKACSFVIMENCGGASGPIWGAAFHGAAVYAGERTELTLFEFAELMKAAVKGIQDTGERSFGRGAVVGDKTLIDALVPCEEELAECAASEDMTAEEMLRRGAQAAAEGAEKTKEIVARMGRAGVVGERSLGYPDAGAYALGIIFQETADGMHYE